MLGNTRGTDSKRTTKAANKKEAKAQKTAEASTTNG